MDNKKIKAYVGFAKKSRKIVYGTDDIIKTKNCKIILISDELSDGSVKKIENFIKNNNINILEFDSKSYLEIIDNISIKAVAITDENLAIAIKKEFAK